MPPQPAKLPVDLVVRRSFQFAWESRYVLAAPAAIFTILSIIADLILIKLGDGAGFGPRAIALAGEEILGLAFAVGIHRWVLLAESRPGAAFFRWDRHFVQYLLMSVVLLLLGSIAAFPALLMSQGGVPVGAAVLALAALVWFVIAMSVMPRLTLALPAAATGDARPMREIWAASTGNLLRLIGVFLLTVFPFLAVAGLLGETDRATDLGAPGTILLVVAANLVQTAELIVVNVMLSLCYDALVRGGGPTGR